MKQELNELVTQYNNAMFMKIHDYKIKDYREKYTNLNEIINQFKIFLASLHYKDFYINYNENDCDKFIESFFNHIFLYFLVSFCFSFYLPENQTLSLRR